MDTKEALKKARLAAARGDKAVARSILAEAAKADSTNETIYLFFAEVAEDRAQAIRALEHVLKLNPDNRIALQSLARLRKENKAAGMNRPMPRGKRDPAAIFGRLPDLVRKQFKENPTRLLLSAVALAVLLPCTFALICTLAWSSFKALGDPSSSSGNTITRTITAAKGGELSLSDGTSLEIPAGALPADTEVTLKSLGVSDSRAPDSEYTYDVGSLYEVDLGPGALQQPVILEIPFDPDDLPEDAEASQVFLSYFDEEIGEWRYAGGTVDLKRSVLRISTDHASIWSPSTWNWGALTAALHKIAKLNIVDIVQGIALFTEECPQQGQVVQVYADPSRSVLQGCVAKDDPLHPELRVINPKAFFVEVLTVSEGNVYFDQTMLGPGEDLRFTANIEDPSPLIVAAKMTRKAGIYLVIDMVVTMLPGANQLGFQGKTIACMTERLGDASYFFSAAESLAINQDGLAASESISRFMLNEDAVRRFIGVASECGFGPASTWSFEGIKQIGGAVSAITSAADFVANYLGGNAYSEFAFSWGNDPVELGNETVAMDMDILQWCMDNGFACIPLPFEPNRPVEWHSFKEMETGALGMNLEPGTVVYSPFEADVYWTQGSPAIYMGVLLPSGNTLHLNLDLKYPESYEALVPDTYNTGRFRLGAGDPLFRYFGLPEDYWDGAGPPHDFEIPFDLIMRADFVPRERMVWGTEYPQGSIRGIPVLFYTMSASDHLPLLTAVDCRADLFDPNVVDDSVFLEYSMDMLRRSGFSPSGNVNTYADLLDEGIWIKDITDDCWGLTISHSSQLGTVVYEVHDDRLSLFGDIPFKKIIVDFSDLVAW